MATTASMAYLLPGVNVCQPAHLEGNVEFATEILPGPPSLVSVQQAVKRDPKKSTSSYSYLPPSDPGSTYSGVTHGTVNTIPDPKDKPMGGKGAAGRAQRASARHQNGTTNGGNALSSADAAGPSFQALGFVDSDITMLDEDGAPSRSTSAPRNAERGSGTANGRVKRKEKGKEKEMYSTNVRVKEEPRTISLDTPEPPTNQIPNDDFCSACRSVGGLIYCDGCPRAFCLCCLNPPVTSGEIPENKWYCQACSHRMKPTQHRQTSFFTPLLKVLDALNPSEFQLPDDIRTFFKDVGTGDKGAYVDTSILKPPRPVRLGQPEVRDTHRLRDKNGQPVLCFGCGKSSLPDGVAAEGPSSKRVRKATAKGALYSVWKNMISCDFCDLHWHLDCLDPPLTTMPSFSKKWMCPNHSEKVIPTKKRLPKQNQAPIEISKPRQFNNGNIEVIPESHLRPQIKPKANVDEVLINGRRYRVPERIILLDFWNKVSNKGDTSHDDSGLMSPLSSLSSLEDSDEQEKSDSRSRLPETEDYQVAQMLCNLRLGTSILPRSLQDATTQTDILLDPSPSTHLARLPKAAKTSVVKRPTLRTAVPSTSLESLSTPGSSTSTPRRKKSTHTPSTEISDRELRSRNRNGDRVSWKDALGDDDEETSLSSLTSASTPGGRASFRVKMEESENFPLLNGDVVTPTNTTPRSGRGRPPKPRTPRSQADLGEEIVKEKRGRKRKAVDDDELYHDAATDRALKGARNGGDKTTLGLREKVRKKQSRSTPPPAPPTSVASVAPTTPTLKIRLPASRTMNNSPTRAPPSELLEAPTPANTITS